MIGLFCPGFISTKVIPHPYDAVLVALRNRGGGMHPTAVGDVLQWLTLKFISSLVNVEGSKTLSSFQFVVGVPMGFERFV